LSQRDSRQRDERVIRGLGPVLLASGLRKGRYGYLKFFHNQIRGSGTGRIRRRWSRAIRGQSGGWLPLTIFARWLIVGLLLGQAFNVPTLAREHISSAGPTVVRSDAAGRTTGTVSPLDHIANAVDGAESSHGQDPGMWRPDPSGPQGPMQISASAASDVGGGDRFDLTQNRVMGTAYLEQLYRRYRNWPDAIAAYNWGLGKMDNWIKAGRLPDQILPGVVVYVRRVIGDSHLCQSVGSRLPQSSPLVAARVVWPEAGSDSAFGSTCTERFAGMFPEGVNKPGPAAPRPNSPFEQAAIKARLSWLAQMRAVFGCTSRSAGQLRCR
jgi:Transglycosylase SLT domain